MGKVRRCRPEAFSEDNWKPILARSAAERVDALAEEAERVDALAEADRVDALAEAANSL